MSKKDGLIKVVEWRVVDWTESVDELDSSGVVRTRTQHRIVIYARGEDGIIYELSGGTWARFPIQADRIVDLPKPVLTPKE